MARIPAHVASGRRAPFPAGVFMGEITKVDENWSEDKTGLALVVTLSNITPFDADSPEVGARPKMQRLQVIFNNQSLVDIVEFTDDVPFALANAATLVTQLAEALGVVQPNIDGSVDFEMEPFLNSLMAGEFLGNQVVFEVKHRAYASRDAKAAAKMSGKKPEADRLDDSISGFQAAGEAAPEPEAEVEATTAPVAPPATPASALRGRARK